MKYSVKVLRALYSGESDLGRLEPLTTLCATTTFRRGDVEINVEYHDYPIYGVYARCGFKWIPASQPITNLYGLWGGGLAPPYHPAQVDNVTSVPEAVLEQQCKELKALSESFDVIYWEHFRHCYPSVACFFKQWFKHSISIFGDDCPASARTKTDPVAKFFDSALHANLMFDGATRVSTAQHYRNQGVSDTHYIALGTSGGFMEGLSPTRVLVPRGIKAHGSAWAPIDRLKRDLAGVARSGFSVDSKIADLASGQRAPIDLVFVGPTGSASRAALACSVGEFRVAGLDVRFHGTGMPDGPIAVREGEALATSLAPLYAQSFSGVIPPIWGLAGTRLWDYWEAGVLVFMHDPVGEMALIDVRPGVHFVEYDGTPRGLLASVLDMRSRYQEAACIVEAGFHKGRELISEYGVVKSIERILFANLNKWRTA